jgi:hypothetical protein
MILKRIFEIKRDEVTGGWTKLHNEELHNFYFSTSIIRMIKSRRMRWTVHVHPWERQGLHTRFWYESQKKVRPLRRTTLKLKDNIKLDLGERGWCDMD